MLIIGMLLIGLGLAWYVVAGLNRRINIIQSIVFTIIAYLASHVLVSGILFWMDQYSVKRTLFACGLLWGLGFISVIIRRLHPEIGGSIREYWMPGLAVLLMLPFVWNSFEFYGMGQDEGVYQTQAICFINGITERQYDFEEYYSLGTEADQGLFEEAVSRTSLVGFYSYADAQWVFDSDYLKNQAISERSGVFHGIPTYAALLALWGSVFGIPNMAGINIVMLICCIFITYEICKRLQITKRGIAIAYLVMCFSPLIIWIAKSSLTETGLTLIWLVFLYLILGEREQERLLSAACVMVYAFYHVSVYVFMPFYIGMYVVLYLYSRNKVNIKAMLLGTAGYLTGYLMQLFTTTEYMSKNYRAIYAGFVNENTMPYLVLGCCVLVIFASIFLSKKQPLLKWNKEKLSLGIRISILILVAILVYRVRNMDMQPIQFVYLSSVAFLIVSGIAVPIFVYGNVLLKTKSWLTSWKRAVILGCFLYCIIVFSVMFLPRIGYYYYYARYLTMYIPLLAIMGGWILQDWKGWKSIPVALLGVACMMPFDLTLLREKDDTRVEWDTLMEIAEELEPGDNVIADVQLFGYYYFPLKAMTGVRVYPVLGDFEEESRRLSTGENTVWYLTVDYGDRAKQSYVLAKEVVNTISQDYNVKYMDWQNPKHNYYLQLPYEFEEREERVQLFFYNANERKGR